MPKKFKLLFFLFFFSFAVYTFFQFPGFQGYEDETYNRIITNLKSGELKTARSGYLQILLETPFIWTGQILDSFLKIEHDKISQIFALFYNPFVSALSVVVMFLIFNLYNKKHQAFWLSLVYAFGTMAFPYATIGMDPTAVLFVLFAIYFLFLFGKKIALVENKKANLYLFLSGFFYFLLFFSKTYYLITGLAFLSFIYFCSRKEKDFKKFLKKLFRYFLLFFSSLIFLAPIYLIANKYNFGGCFSGPYKLSNELFGGENFIFGIYGLLFSFGKSLFIYNPVLLLSVLLFSQFYKKNQKEAFFVLIYTISLVLFVARIHWWSDETWGPRYLLSLSAVGLLPLIALDWQSLKKDGKQIKKIVFGLIIAFSFFFQLLGTLVRYDVFPYSFYEIYNATGYNVLASQEYQYIPQFAPYFVNYQLLTNKILRVRKPLIYKIIYSPPMEEVATKKGSVFTKEIVYDNNKYQAHCLNFWWMNVPNISPFLLFFLFILIFGGLFFIFYI